MIVAALSAAITALFVYILISGKRSFEVWYLLVSSGTITCYFFIKAVKFGRRITESRYCYMEIEPDCLVVRQAENSGHYESCRIFFDEMEKIVEGSRRGIPEFYVIIREDATRSFVLLDEEEKEGHIFLVKSFGYQTEPFREFYTQLRWAVPGKVRIVGTKEQETWNMKKPQAGFLLFAALAALYLIPKIGTLLF